MEVSGSSPLGPTIPKPLTPLRLVRPGGVSIFRFDPRSVRASVRRVRVGSESMGYRAFGGSPVVSRRAWRSPTYAPMQNVGSSSTAVPATSRHEGSETAPYRQRVHRALSDGICVEYVRESLPSSEMAVAPSRKRGRLAVRAGSRVQASASRTASKASVLGRA